MVSLKLDDLNKNQANSSSAGEKRASMSSLKTLKEDRRESFSLDALAMNIAWHDEFPTQASTNSSPPSDDFSDDFSDMASPSDDIIDMVVRTHHEEKVPKQINIHNTDLTSLKEDDAFLYYSIPSVKSAEWLDDDINPTLIKDSALAGRIPSIYTRQSRISVETAPVHDLSDYGIDAMECSSINMEDDGDDWLVDFLDIQGNLQ
jgi:hypothetical protein